MYAVSHIGGRRLKARFVAIGFHVDNIHIWLERCIMYGDDVAVSALGQTNFLLFVFGLFFIFNCLYSVAGISRFKVFDVPEMQ